MQLLGTCGLLIIIVITSLSLPIIQGMVWSGFICSARDHRGCCYNWVYPTRPRPPCAPVGTSRNSGQKNGTPK
ncbi:GM11396 [Drosophila sechellia]|uniref:GM11396 n=1 Tax=Drosophila sechellia TaxID=7238 RepID=B4IDK5_DROSE|nr:GM11396 [Drosophila sechellia]